MSVSGLLVAVQVSCVLWLAAGTQAASDITFARWAHATNSRQQVDEALKGDDPVFIEADVALENGMTVLEPPLGAPWTMSLNELLYLLTARQKRVTLKLDFRNTDVLPQAFGVLMVARTEVSKVVRLVKGAVGRLYKIFPSTWLMPDRHGT